MLRSKSHWDYEEDFIEACREDLTIDTDWLRRNMGFVAERDTIVVGFFGLSHKGNWARVEHFFVAKEAIGTGVGNAMWAEYVRQANSLDISIIEIESEPYAKPFYERMGARQTGEVPSTVFPGRMLPLMEVILGGSTG